MLSRSLASASVVQLARRPTRTAANEARRHKNEIGAKLAHAKGHLHIWSDMAVHEAADEYWASVKWGFAMGSYDLTWLQAQRTSSETATPARSPQRLSRHGLHCGAEHRDRLSLPLLVDRGQVRSGGCNRVYSSRTVE